MEATKIIYSINGLTWDGKDERHQDSDFIEARLAFIARSWIALCAGPQVRGSKAPPFARLFRVWPRDNVLSQFLPASHHSCVYA